jgi:hypothetical protein
MFWVMLLLWDLRSGEMVHCSGGPYCFSLVQRRDFVKHKSIRVSSKKIYNARTLTFAFRHMGPYADGTHSVQDGTHKTRDPYTRRTSDSGYRDPWPGKAVDRGEGVGGPLPPGQVN